MWNPILGNHTINEKNEFNKIETGDSQESQPRRQENYTGL